GMTSKGLLPLVLLAGCASQPSAAPFPREKVAAIERHLSMMGTSLEVRVEALDRERALEASERAVAAIEAAEGRLSTWRDDTELARLNRAPVGQSVPLSPALAADLAAARSCWEETDGAFDPSVGGLVRVWGLRQGGRRPDALEMREALAATGLERLRLIPEGAAVRERTDLVLEEGGFGKGAGLADALDVLTEQPGVTRALLDLGGQVAVLGRAEDRWAIPVADPLLRDQPAVALMIDRGSVSTSGNSERGIVVEGERLGHILDPRTGRPAPDFGSLTVWTADPVRADCLSTGLYVLGPEAALAWAAEHPGVEVLVLRPRRERVEALASAGLQGKLEVLADNVDVEFWSAEWHESL
ncbi:MAG TPA: FAD:protein FMN transferase, partial [Thermoanaerobaculia bacterium]|nr:FAD:protein FMN transferase [Thermoanaerobaculia bacterium]